MKTSTYDVHNSCNLACEGCSYFVTDRRLATAKPSDDAYDRFFASEASRGVNYPIFSGAEPSLNQGPLHVAARHWDHGAVFTNGIKRIDAALPFRVVISVWGGAGSATKLRGANTYRKALDAAAGDPRAIVFFTVTRLSIDDLPEVAADCSAAGLALSFNVFSKSTEYARRLESASANDNEFFRFSTNENNLELTPRDRIRAADLIDELIERYPGTIVFTKRFNSFMFRAPTLHDIDPVTKLATNCGVLLARSHRSYNFDLSRDERKDCCAPDFDCRGCRVLGAALATRVRSAASEARLSADGEFLELLDLMTRLYYWK